MCFTIVYKPFTEDRGQFCLQTTKQVWTEAAILALKSRVRLKVFHRILTPWMRRIWRQCVGVSLHYAGRYAGTDMHMKQYF